MSDSYSAVCFTREDAHVAVTRAYAHAQAMFANGEPTVLIECKPGVEAVSVKQRRFFHGPVLGQISEQAKVDGVRFTLDIWKEFFRRKFVGDHGFRWETQRLPGDKHARPRRIRISTEELGVRDYAKFCDEVIQYGAEELGVSFVFTNEEQALLRHKPRAKHGDEEEVRG